MKINIKNTYESTLQFLKAFINQKLLISSYSKLGSEPSEKFSRTCNALGFTKILYMEKKKDEKIMKQQ